MNILMIYPCYTVTFWSFKYALKYISKKAAFLPLGLHTVASMLPREWKVRLIDPNIEKLQQKDMEWADYVMISANRKSLAEAKTLMVYGYHFRKMSEKL